MSWTGAGELVSPWSSALPERQDWAPRRLAGGPAARPSAWLSCDIADADPVRFVAAIIEALGRAWGQPELARTPCNF